MTMFIEFEYNLASIILCICIGNYRDLRIALPVDLHTCGKSVT